MLIPPQGKMSMTIPQFVKLEHDTTARKAFVSVEDKEIKKQREMWGMSFIVLRFSKEILMEVRNHKSVSTEPYLRCI